MSNIKDLRNTLERRKGSRLEISRNISAIRKEIREQRRKLPLYEQAKEIIQQVGKETQKQLQYHIEDITSLALEAVFENPYKLKVDFIERRNKTECDLSFLRGENLIDPISASGVGAIDVASFSLRISSWNMKYPRSRNTIILDEPLRFLSTDYHEKASLMIKEISKKLGIQFIIITHEQELTAYADKIFETSIINGRTKVT